LLFDERNLLCTPPAFELLLQGDGVENFPEVFVVDQDDAVVTLREGCVLGIAVLPEAALEVVGYPM